MPHCWPDVTKPNITQRTPTHSSPLSLSSVSLSPARTHALCFLADHGTVDNWLSIFAVPVPLRIKAGSHGMRHRAQQGVAVPVMEQYQLLLLVGNEAAAASQRSAAHLQYLECGIAGEHKVLIGTHKAEDNRRGAAYDHQIGANGHRERSNHSGQIQPALDGGCQLRDAL